MKAPSPVEDWLRVHRALLEKEAAFTDLALQAASGQVSLEHLNEEREDLMALRARCTAAYEKAFPKDPKTGAGASPAPDQGDARHDARSSHARPPGRKSERLGSWLPDRICGDIRDWWSVFPGLPALT